MVFKEKSQKQLQVGEQIKREIANIFLRNDIFKDSNFKVTVCEADISPDLKNVKIFLSVFGNIAEEKMVKELNDNNYYFRKKLLQSLKLNNIPQIKFFLDKSSQSALDIESKIYEESKNIPISKE